MDEPLLWIDIETTGLEPRRHEILEVAAVLTTGSLNTIKYYHAVVAHADEFYMDDWCWKTHSESGLIAESRKSQNSLEQVEYELCEFIRGLEKPVPAGSTIGFDLRFLRQDMPTFFAALHYRSVDVSSIKELVKRWYPDLPLPPKSEIHRSLPDIEESIHLLKWMRENVFR